MNQLPRMQISFHASSGEVLTSTKITIGSHFGEFFTLDTVAFLTDRTRENIQAICGVESLRTYVEEGVTWIPVQEVIWLMDLLLNGIRGSIRSS